MSPGLSEAYARDGVVCLPGVLDADPPRDPKALPDPVLLWRGRRVRSREGGAGPRIAGFHDRMKAGDPFRHPGFLKLV